MNENSVFNYIPHNPIRGITKDGFTGQEHIDQLGIINFNARLYDPEFGIMLQADTIIPDGPATQSMNRYSYVFNNPLSYTDPTGHVPQDGQPNQISEGWGGMEGASQAFGGFHITQGQGASQTDFYLDYIRNKSKENMPAVDGVQNAAVGLPGINEAFNGNDLDSIGNRYSRQQQKWNNNNCNSSECHGALQSAMATGLNNAYAKAWKDKNYRDVDYITSLVKVNAKARYKNIGTSGIVYAIREGLDYGGPSLATYVPDDIKDPGDGGIISLYTELWNNDSSDTLTINYDSKTDIWLSTSDISDLNSMNKTQTGYHSVFGLTIIHELTHGLKFNYQRHMDLFDSGKLKTTPYLEQPAEREAEQRSFLFYSKYGNLINSALKEGGF